MIFALSLFAADALDSYAEETYLFTVVSADRVRVDVEVIGTGEHCLGGMSKDEARALWRKLAAEGYARDEEAESCALGTCGHYTCTEGEALVDWERTNAHRHEDPAFAELRHVC